MTDPIAEANANINAPSSTEPSLMDEIKEGMHALEEKVEHLFHPETEAAKEQVGETAAAPTTDSGAPSVEPSSTPATVTEPGNAASAATGATSSAAVGEGEGGNVGAASAAIPAIAASAPSASGTSSLDSAEHPHTSILRRLTTTLRRKFNVFDGEVEAILKDAESHL